MKYRSTKTYGHELGLSCVFRQPFADSHCNQLHGYSLSFKLTFEAKYLDDNNWVMDFGALKPIKEFLINTFDHTLVVGENDPHWEIIRGLGNLGIADVRMLPAVGCEAFAAYVANYVDEWLQGRGHHPRVRLIEVECREHGANSGSWVA